MSYRKYNVLGHSKNTITPPCININFFFIDFNVKKT